MNYPIPVTLAAWLLIALAIAVSPIYGLWLCGGMIADWMERRALCRTGQ